MDDYISISSLNDFIFCPYSIYLHNVYMESDKDLFHATPQIRGQLAHESTDNKTYSTHKKDIMSISVCSERLRLIGKIDLYKGDQKILIERKNNLKHIYIGQYYQLWAQYFCMIEMGYEIGKLAFYEISTNKLIPVNIPRENEASALENFICQYREYNPDKPITRNPQKCAHCIYCNLCDKTDTDNVFT